MSGAQAGGPPLLSLFPSRRRWTMSASGTPANVTRCHPWSSRSRRPAALTSSCSISPQCSNQRAVAPCCPPP